MYTRARTRTHTHTHTHTHTPRRGRGCALWPVVVFRDSWLAVEWSVHPPVASKHSVWLSMRDCRSCSPTESLFPIVFLLCLLLSCPWFLILPFGDPLTFRTAVVQWRPSTREVASSPMGERCKFTSGCSLYSPRLRFVPVRGVRWTS